MSTTGPGTAFALHLRRRPSPRPIRLHTRATYSAGVGSKFKGESGRTYRLIEPLQRLEANNASTIWKAIDNADESQQYIVKEPSLGDDQSLG